ncbi:hypothetical protein, partial [Aeromonas caviae]|uniref:hypothetical protein n=1 Tax=Aeromonas caviae TaxID=648 RepID=UPI001CC6B681
QDIADEAERKKGAYKHLDIEQVKDPIIQFGMTPSEVVKVTVAIGLINMLYHRPKAFPVLSL